MGMERQNKLYFKISFGNVNWIEIVQDFVIVELNLEVLMPVN